MDCVVVETVKNPLRTPETRAVLTRLGTRLGRLVVEGRNALGYVVLRCDCGETVALTSKQVAAGKRYQCDSCDTWDRKPLIRKYLGDEIYHNIRRRGVDARQRCENPSNHSFSDYGGRGIKFDYDSLDQYTLHVGILAKEFGLDKQVDRADNDGNYSPDNVRLVASKINCRNRRSSIMIKGIALSSIAEAAGLDPIIEKSRYSSFNTKIRELISVRELSISEVFDLANDFKNNPQNNNLRKKSPARKLSVGGVPLTEFVANMGFPKNRALYSAAKDYLRGMRSKNQVPTADQVRDHLMMYAIRRGIKGTLH